MKCMFWMNVSFSSAWSPAQLSIHFFCYGISSIREHGINSIISFYRFGKRGRLPYFDMEDLPLHPQVCFFPFSNLKIDINHVTFYCWLKKSSTFIKSDGKVGKPRTRFSTLFRLSSSEWIRRKLLADSKQPTKRRGEKLSEKWNAHDKKWNKICIHPFSFLDFWAIFNATIIFNWS